MPREVALSAREKEFIVSAYTFFSMEREQHRLRRGDTRELVAKCLSTSVSTVKRVIRDHTRNDGQSFEDPAPHLGRI
ncbi:hypothetical protein DVH05_013610 [Phytophthora capsici]|nr:hypothetical protein DVH05_013610 [Phytophthora capsici]